MNLKIIQDNFNNYLKTKAAADLANAEAIKAAHVLNLAQLSVQQAISDAARVSPLPGPPQ